MPSWAIRSAAQMISYDFYWFILMNILITVDLLIYVLLIFRTSLVNHSFPSFYFVFVSTLLKLIVHIWSSEAEGELLLDLMWIFSCFFALFFIGEYVNICYVYLECTLFWRICLLICIFLLLLITFWFNLWLFEIVILIISTSL